MTSYAGIVGHGRSLRVLRSSLAAGRTPHAYLFWGPEGIGKEAAAQETARILLCADPAAVQRPGACGGCPPCRKLAAGNHPDLHVVVASGASISVGEIRALQETLSYQAFERGRKVAIIRDAFRMTREASNALLKTVEEPPLGTHLFLLAHHRNQLLPTLVSRCQALRFDPLTEAEVAELLEARGMDSAAAKRLAALSGGAPGAVLTEDAEGLAAAADEAEEACKALAAPEAAPRLAFAARWAGDKERLGRRLDSLERALRERALASAGRAAVDPRALGALEDVVEVRRLLDRNVNVQLALDALFLGVLGDGVEGYS